MPTAKAIALIVSVIMPADQPDINHVERAKDFPSCWAAAKEFAERDLSDALRARGALGLKATCGFMERPANPGEEELEP